MNNFKLFVAMKAFVEFEGKILVLRESSQYQDGTNGGRYDVPGGRIEPGEAFDQALRREIFEECGLSVTLAGPFFVGEWRPIVRGEAWQVIGTFIHCIAESAKVTLSSEHDQFRWIYPESYNEYTVIPNLAAAFEAFCNR